MPRFYVLDKCLFTEKNFLGHLTVKSDSDPFIVWQDILLNYHLEKMNGISSKFLKIYKYMYLKFLNKTSICIITSYYTVIEIFLFY